jgi:hypothetical protein
VKKIHQLARRFRKDIEMPVLDVWREQLEDEPRHLGALPQQMDRLTRALLDLHIAAPAELVDKVVQVNR